VFNPIGRAALSPIFPPRSTGTTKLQDFFMDQDAQKRWEAKTLRSWHLAVLRFAVTLDNADRLAVLAIAAEIDRLGPSDKVKPPFGFFRRTSAELCAAILRQDEPASAVLQQHLARIDDDRLKRTFAATIEARQPTEPSVSRPVKREKSLWRGLAPRGILPL
jgi:hypothetical protein